MAGIGEDAPPSFDETAPVQDVPPPFSETSDVSSKPSGISKTETALRELGKGATIGLQPKLSPLAEMGFAKLDPTLSPEAYQDLYGSRPYSALSKSYLEENKAAHEANPKTALPFNILGGTPLAIATGGVLNPVTQGIIQGAGQAYGESERPDLTGQAIDTAIGGVTGGITGKLLGSESLKKAAQYTGSKAFGFMRNTISKAGGLPKVRQAMQTILDKAPRIVLPWKNAETMKAGLETLEGDTGSVISGTLKKMDDLGIQTLKPEEVVSKINNSAEIKGLGNIQKIAKDHPGVARVLEDIRGIIGSRGSSSTFEEFQYIKNLLRNDINWRSAEASDAAATLENKAKKAIYHSLVDSIDSSLDKAAEIANKSGLINDPDLMKKFMDAKELYGAAATAMTGVKYKLSGETGNKLLNLTTAIAAGPAFINELVQGNPMRAAAAAGIGIGGNLAGKYGYQSSAPLLNLLSKGTQAVPIGGPVGGYLGGRAAQFGNDLFPSALQQQ